MTQKAPPFPGSHDFIAFLRVIDEVGRGEGDYRKRLEAWVNRVAVVQADFTKAVEGGNKAAEEANERAERDMEAREEALERATEAMEAQIHQAASECQMAARDAQEGLESQRKDMMARNVEVNEELKFRAEQIAQSEVKVAQMVAEAEATEAAAAQVLAKAEAMKAQYAEMMDRITAATG